jgi:hypothetical protein
MKRFYAEKYRSFNSWPQARLLRSEHNLTFGYGLNGVTRCNNLFTALGEALVRLSVLCIQGRPLQVSCFHSDHPGAKRQTSRQAAIHSLALRSGKLFGCSLGNTERSSRMYARSRRRRRDCCPLLHSAAGIGIFKTRIPAKPIVCG